MIIVMVAAPTLADKPTLLGEMVTLRPVSEADVSGLAEMLADSEGNRLTGTRTPDGPVDLEKARQWYATRAAHHDRLDLAIVERATGEYVGEAVLNKLDPDNRSCSFRISLIGPRAFGRGLGSEATRLILDYAFTTVGLHRVELDVFDFNPRARHVYEKVGFRHEGTRRQALRWNNEWIDTHIMAIIAEEWANRLTQRA